MAGESVLSVHVDQLLSNLAVSYRPDLSGFIADQVCPTIPVQHESDLYPIFTQGDFFATDVDDLVADRSEPRAVEFSHALARYQCHRRELAWDISDRERGNADDQLRLELNKQIGTLGRLYLKREVRVAALLRKTSNGGGLALGANAANDWGVASTTTIESDIITGKEAIRQSVGVRPNVIVVPEHVATKLTLNAQFTDKIKYTYPATGTRALLEEPYPNLPPILFGMRVVVPGQIVNSSAEGVADSYADIWGNHVRMLYVTNGPALDNPSVAYTFQSESLVTRRQRQERRRVDWFAIGMTIEERVIADHAGYEIASCTS